MCHNKTGQLVLGFHPALHVRRKVWVSERYKQNTAMFWQILETLVAAAHPKRWSLLPSVESFVENKDKAIRQRRSASVIALVVDEEHAAFSELASHVFTTEQFLEFTRLLDPSRTFQGMSQ